MKSWNAFSKTSIATGFEPFQKGLCPSHEVSLTRAEGKKPTNHCFLIFRPAAMPLAQAQCRL